MFATFLLYSFPTPFLDISVQQFSISIPLLGTPLTPQFHHRPCSPLLSLFFCPVPVSMASMSTAGSQSEDEITNAFDGIFPPPSVIASLSASRAATSSSSPSQSRLFDVFINHRGPDVKHTLASHLYTALNDMGLRVFLDSEELELGDSFHTRLQDAMRSASLHIAVFSPTYAQSPWCLNELSFMLRSGKPIIPVFYRVQPSDLRWVIRGKGLYINAFLEYQEKGRYGSQKLQEWKMALHKASNISGQIINNDDEEQWVFENIVNHVLGLLKTVPLDVAKHPVGLDELVADFEATVGKSEKAHPSVQIVGIWGMAGSGKTTLAKELFNRKCSFVERSSFLFDVGGYAAKSQLHKIQIKLLHDLGLNHQKFDTIIIGKEIISNLLGSVRVLVVVDDVDHTDQLDVLLPAKSSLAWGSLIIITTREKDVLKSWGISSIYQTKAMNDDHAKQLFSWHAFLQPYPLGGFEELVEKFVSACKGLPLTLKVLGSQVYGCSSKDLWEDMLHKISKILPNDIRTKLKVSYDSLDEEEKQIFLDIACFFIGKDKVIATAVWEESGWNTLYSWERLANKCLVEQDNNNHIRMHDHLRDIGREIANTQSPYRLWSPNQITHFEKQEEIIHIRGITMDAAAKDVHNVLTFLLNRSTGLCGCGSSKTRRSIPVGLKFLLVRGDYQSNLHISKLSRELTWFSWTESASRSLPSWLSLKNLRVLELHSSQKLVSLWKDQGKAPLQLRVLIIYDCPKLERIPKSIEYLYILKKIVIKGCNRLKEIDVLPIAVEDIQVKDCKLLRNINGIYNLVNLRGLMLSGCPMMDVLPSISNLASLKVLELTGVNKVEKIQGLQHCTALEKLMLNCQCWEMPDIESLEQLRRLRRLELIAKKRVTIESCIQTIRKWPEETIICTKAVADVGSHLNSSSFPNLSVHYFANKEISCVASHFLTLPQKQSSDANPIMLCLVINCVCQCMELVIKVDLLDAVISMEVEEGKWILIGVFTQHSRCLTAQNFYIHRGRTESNQEQTEILAEVNEVENGFIMIGEEKFIVEAFYHLLGGAGHRNIGAAANIEDGGTRSKGDCSC